MLPIQQLLLHFCESKFFSIFFLLFYCQLFICVYIGSVYFHTFFTKLTTHLKCELQQSNIASMRAHTQNHKQKQNPHQCVEFIDV